MSISKFRNLSAATTLLVVAAGSHAGTITLDPYLPASTPTTGGAGAQFIQIGNGWHDSTVLWDESTHTYGQGDPIGTYSWGSGLWGIADFNTILGGGVSPISSWSGTVSSINFGDGCYNSEWSGTWGPATLAPFFSVGVGCASTVVSSDAANAEDNWISYFTGYIRITTPGEYNFSVLYDDGFFLNLYGANGAEYSISKDFLNPRDRLGFGDNFLLSPGLYAFQLGAYDHLQAGVVDLRWQQGGGGDWTLIPPENLASIPEPDTIGLLATGLGALMLLAARRRRRALAEVPDPHVS